MTSSNASGSSIPTVARTRPSCSGWSTDAGHSGKEIELLRKIIIGARWLTPARRATSLRGRPILLLGLTNCSAVSISARRRSPGGQGFCSARRIFFNTIYPLSMLTLGIFHVYTVYIDRADAIRKSAADHGAF